MKTIEYNGEVYNVNQIIKIGIINVSTRIFMDDEPKFNFIINFSNGIELRIEKESHDELVKVRERINNYVISNKLKIE